MQLGEDKLFGSFTNKNGTKFNVYYQDWHSHVSWIAINLETKKPFVCSCETYLSLVSALNNDFYLNRMNGAPNQ